MDIFLEKQTLKRKFFVIMNIYFYTIICIILFSPCNPVTLLSGHAQDEKHFRRILVRIRRIIQNDACVAKFLLAKKLMSESEVQQTSKKRTNRIVEISV